MRYFCILALLFSAPGLFAAIPIQERTLRGAAAADARFKVLATAESCLGTPYRYAGIDRRGLDCSGLVYLSFREGLTYTIPRTSESIYTWTERIATSELAPGDLVFFVTAGTSVSHVGIYTGEGRFIHSASEGPTTGVIYSYLNESYWKRTYKGAGRALPWDEEAALALATARAGNIIRPAGSSSAGVSGGEARPATSGRPAPAGVSASGEDGKSALPGPVWKDEGLFTGFGVTWTWGGFFEGAPSPFRGIAALATLGYKWSNYRAGLELRPEWDRALGVFRLPFTLSIGTDIVQIFGGPAYTFGEPDLELSGGERKYRGGGAWRWELGLSGAFPPLRIGPGALSLYGELAWQPYHWEDGKKFDFKPDMTANLRLSMGIRYLWRIGSSK